MSKPQPKRPSQRPQTSSSQKKSPQNTSSTQVKNPPLPPNLEGWQPYNLDHSAQGLVLNYRDEKDVLNETHKMRMTVSYGLERFWGEHLRLKRENQNKSDYWKAVWDELGEILAKAGVSLPNDSVISHLPAGNKREREAKEADETKKIREMANKIWQMPMDDQRVALMVLTQFCDSLVWWCQRYKKKKDS
nr:hypothetical protein [Cyanobacterium stanieri]